MSTVLNIGLAIEFDKPYKRIINLAIKELNLSKQNRLKILYEHITEMPKEKINALVAAILSEKQNKKQLNRG